jgi:hypothetical protein
MEGRAQVKRGSSLSQIKFIIINPAIPGLSVNICRHITEVDSHALGQNPFQVRWLEMPG